MWSPLSWAHLGAVLGVWALLLRLRRSFLVFALLALPGTLCHEGAHWLAGILLNGHPEGFTVWPRRVGDGYALGSVGFGNLRWYNRCFIGLAPLVLLPLAWALLRWRMRFPLDPLDLFDLREIGWAYLAATLIHGAMPSGQDLRVAAKSPLGWALLLAAGFLAQRASMGYWFHVSRTVRAPARYALGHGTFIAESEAIQSLLMGIVTACRRLHARGLLAAADGNLSVRLPDGGILTHCNTGGLVTTGIGTALGAIRRAFERGKRIHVFVDETRPLLQGGRLTAWELGRLGIPHTLITDSMAPILMRDGRVQRVMVGADRIAANGDFANKVGTYGVAVAARHHGIPFHPVAPYSTVDPACPDGAAIPIEERKAEEVRGFGTLRWSPKAAPVYNPAFDVTPVELVESLVLDRGVYSPEALATGILKGGWNGLS